VFESHDNINNWTQIGGQNTVAVGQDCPFVAHGPTSSLSVCESACANDGSCNLVNFNPLIPDCVFRACADPLHPELSTQPNYTVWATTRELYGLDAATFKFQSTGFTDDILHAAFVRYSAIIFGFGSGKPFDGVLIPGLTVRVLSPDDSLHMGVDESYSLIAPNPSGAGWATLTAATVFGALRGLETFSQLVQWNSTSSSYFIAFSNISDFPRFPFRGVMVGDRGIHAMFCSEVAGGGLWCLFLFLRAPPLNLKIDTARHFLTVPAIKEVVNAMSFLKLNTLHLHLSDDDSFRRALLHLA
jgi:hypothetical protein